MLMKYVAKNGRTVLFDDWCDDQEDNGYEDGGFWVSICESCKKKYKGVLKGHIDDFGSGCCSVYGCNNNEDDDEDFESFYVDFARDEVTFIKSSEGKDWLKKGV